jgi:hypothetical protein
VADETPSGELVELRRIRDRYMRLLTNERVRHDRDTAAPHSTGPATTATGKPHAGSKTPHDRSPAFYGGFPNSTPGPNQQ